jgi:hypothetical protein
MLVKKTEVNQHVIVPGLGPDRDGSRPVEGLFLKPLIHPVAFAGKTPYATGDIAAVSTMIRPENAGIDGPRLAMPYLAR